MSTRQGHCENAFYVPAGNTKLGLIDTGDIGLSKSNYKQHLLPVFLWHPPSFGWYSDVWFVGKMLVKTVLLTNVRFVICIVPKNM